MSKASRSAGMRLGMFLGHAYRKFATAEGRALRFLPRPLATLVKVGVRGAAVGSFLYFAFMPVVIASFAIAALIKLSHGLSFETADLSPRQKTPEPQLEHGNDGYGLYQDGNRVG